MFAIVFVGPDVVTGIEKKITLGPDGAVAVFLSAKCPCSDSHAQELQSLARQFPKIQFVGIHSNADETQDLTRGYFSSKKFEFPVLEDSSGQYAEKYRALKTPHAFLLDSNGTVIYQGGVSDSTNAAQAQRFPLRNALSDWSQGRKVQTPAGRTLGCMIKRKSS